LSFEDKKKKSKEKDEIDLESLEVIAVDFENSTTESDSFDADKTIDGLLYGTELHFC
jgi:hypothetical protein